MLQILEPCKDHYKTSEANLTLNFHNGSVYALKHAKDPDCKRGPSLKFLHIDEAQDFDGEDFISIFRPLLAAHQAPCLISGTKKRGSWFLKEWLAASQGEIENAAAFWFPSTSNPTIPLTEWHSIQRDLERRGRLDIWENEYVCDPHAGGNAGPELKYPEFDRRVHVCQPFRFPSDYRHFFSEDWGMTDKHPTGAVWAAVSPDGMVYIYDEYLKAGVDIPSSAKAFLDQGQGRQKIEAFILDENCWNRESDGKSAAQRFIECGLRPAFKSRREDKAFTGASTVKSYLKPVIGLPKLQIFPNCTQLINELESLKWDDKLNDNLCFIAGTKVLCLDGWKNIEKITINDYVLTRDGYKNLIRHGRTKNLAVVYKLKVSNGKTIIGTWDHPIFLQNGQMKKLAELKSGDRLFDTTSLILIQSVIWKLKLSLQKLKDSMGSIIINWPNTINTAGGINRIYCTESFGHTIMGRYPLNMRYITRIMTSIITKFQIWKLCPDQRTAASTCPASIGENRAEKLCLKLHKNMPLNGLVQMKEKFFINGLEKRYGKIKSYLKRIAIFVAESIKHIFQIALNSVILTVKWQIFGHAAVESVTRLNTKLPVYNLTIEGTGEYIANGLLVHNTDSARYLLVFLSHLDWKPKKDAPVIPFQVKFSTKFGDNDKFINPDTGYLT